MGNFAGVSEQQNKRDAIVSKYFLSDSDLDSIWMKAAKVMVKVDGNLNNIEFTKQKPGLVDQCNYKEAIKVLGELWKSFDKDDGVVLPGHVATRIFEVINQAQGIHQGVMDKESSYFLIENL